MIDDLEDSEDERAVELSSIAAIFPELVVDAQDPFSATIHLPIEPTTPLAVLFRPLAGGALPADLPTPPNTDSISEGGRSNDGPPLNRTTTNNTVQDIHHLSHFPPLSLQISLPSGYPTQTSPVFRVHTTPSWLPQTKLEELRKAGLTLWEELGRDQVVYAYIDYLQQEAERGFDLRPSLNVSQEMKIALLDFDIKAKRGKFERGTFECGVCLGGLS